jgi:hypothetical protein
MLKAATLRKILGDKVFRKNKQNAIIDAYLNIDPIDTYLNIDPIDTYLNIDLDAYLNIDPKNINITDKNKTRADVAKKTAIIKSAKKPQNIQEKVFRYFTPTIKDTANSVSRKGMADKREEYGNSSGTIQNTAIANSSRDVNMIEKADERDEKIMTNNPALSWEPETGHDKIEESYGVAFDTYDPDTGELNMRMKDSTGRTTNRVITENVDDDTYFNYIDSPSKGRWATNKDRQQDIKRGNRLYYNPQELQEEYDKLHIDEGGVL